MLALAVIAASGAERPGRKWSTLERLRPERLAAVHEARQRLASRRQELPRLGVYEDFRAVLHVHAEDAEHTAGRRAQVLEAALATGVRIVGLTDHRGPKPDTWQGVRGGVLFLAGSEEDGSLRFPGPDGGLRFLSHPEERREAIAEGFDGLEIYNRHTDAKDEDEFNRWFRAARQDPAQWAALVDAWKRYPDEFFAAGADYWPELFARWDRENAARASGPLTAEQVLSGALRIWAGIAANDAHRNQVFQGTVFDPYEVSFRNVTTHVLARELTEAEVRRSLREGRAYVAHDWLCDPAGFAFIAANNLGVFETGDAAPLAGTTRLSVQAPVAARLKLVRDGTVVSEVHDSRLTLAVKEPGAYRVEAWLEVDGEERPWIYSNPIYVQRLSLESVRLPSMELSPGVEAVRDVSYAEGAPEHAAKHKLDIYAPKGRTNAPVFVFLHGGSWRSGDRAMYTPLGNRFAREGIVTVVPSYRLAPQSPHPAQIEDAAAAFVWVVRNIEKYGGDPKRIYLGGHSAGGHLAALLALDARHVERHDISPRAIRGVAALSGVYEIRGQESVFGSDEQVRREASPLNHVKAGVPPFLITYCQWDYLTLPQQARRFHGALESAGAASRLVFIPRQSHISEMLNIVKDDDPTVRAILEFIGGAGGP